MIDVRISLPYNIREQMDRISPNFVYVYILISVTTSRILILISYVGIVTTSSPFLLISNIVMALDECQNFVSTQYL